MSGLWITFMPVLGLIAVLIPISGLAQQNLQKLKGSQIRAAIAGMEITDQVHWRDVYERSGALRSSSMGHTRTGKWSIEGDELCLDLAPPDAGCYEVWRAGKNIELRPTGAGTSLEGILQRPTDNQSGQNTGGR
jgi:hypothetical protein